MSEPYLQNQSALAEVSLHVHVKSRIHQSLRYTDGGGGGGIIFNYYF